MIIKRISDFFTKKKIKNYVLKTERSFLAFEEIEISAEYSDLVIKLDKNKNADIISEYVSLTDKIEKHNKKVSDLRATFSDIINQNGIKTILKNIDDYPLDLLKSFNEVAIKVNQYELTERFPEKEQYLAYSKALGEIIDDYQNIVKQHSLINEYNCVISAFEDKYMDFETAEEIIKPIRAKISEIAIYGNKYYSVPKIDEKLVERHNEDFIEKHINDEIFNDVNGKSLDYDQRKAVLCDPKSSLIVAGAGAGKTLTICGKVQYLISTGKCSPGDILLLSYSSASAADLAQKIKTINPFITVKTFHALGLEILNRYSGTKLAIEDQFSASIRKYFDDELPKDSEAMYDLYLFYGLYLSSNNAGGKRYENEGEKFEDLKEADYKTLKDQLKSLREDGYHETIKNEFVKSYEELVIANFLFINGVKYEYERSYQVQTSTPEKRQYTPDFYLSDYGIYYEHFGINRDNKTPQYSEEEEKIYLEGIEWKRRIHAENKTVCIETYSYEFAEDTIFENLKQRLKACGVNLSPLTPEKLKDEFNCIFHGKDLGSFFNLTMTFLNLFKSRFDETGFDLLPLDILPTAYERNRAALFIRICKRIYNYYRSNLKEQNKIDFDDMILKSEKSLDYLDDYKFKYIIVDEFQDISLSRTKFLQKLIAHGNSKLFAVGDDWQAIYRFAGCDIGVFLHFDQYFKDSKINYITSTHRNSAELQNIVEPFITANPEQYVKHIKSELHQKTPVRIIFHDDDKEDAFTEVLDKIGKENEKARVLVLGRNRNDIKNVDSHVMKLGINGDIKYYGYPNMEIVYKTVHQSKGLESDYVILISGENAKNGFPNKMEDDKLLDLVLSSSGSYPFAEERRLFYVALTRTKSVVYILSNKSKPSAFVKEIASRVEAFYPPKAESKNNTKTLCPWCKTGILQLRESNNSPYFYGCSNYPYCNYTINDAKAVKINNRCPSCGDILVERYGKNGKFIGCHSYPYCKYTTDI